MYLIPAIFTVCNIGCGLLSIFAVFDGRYTLAAWLVVLGIIFDGFDGIIARAIKKNSSIGLELDSFADFITFCIAPAVLIYEVYLVNLRSNQGMVVCLIFIFAGAIRLARYNIDKLQKNEEEGNYIKGLPTPAAAGLLISLVLIFELFERFEGGVTKKVIPLIMKEVPLLFKLTPFFMILISILMLSKIPYFSFSRLNLVKKVSFRTFVLIIVSLFLIYIYPENMIFLFFSVYLLSGLIEYLIKIYKFRKTLDSRNG